jgi:hypothetical protein
MAWDVIRRDDVKRILDRLGHDGESIQEWCRRNDVDEGPVMRFLAASFGFTGPEDAALVIHGFRLGHEARRGDEPRSKLPAVDRNGSRYGVEFVVIDREDGRIVGDPSRAQGEAEALAGAYNDIDAQSRRAGREA